MDYLPKRVIYYRLILVTLIYITSITNFFSQSTKNTRYAFLNRFLNIELTKHNQSFDTVHHKKYLKEINEDDVYWNYIEHSFSEISLNNKILKDGIIQKASDPYELLEYDSLFKSTLKTLFEKIVLKNIPKDTFSLEQALNTAVKFFTVMKIKEDYYVGKVCGEFNFIKQTEKVRAPYLEAFCFSLIVRNYSTEGETNFLKEFTSALRKLYTINLGLDQNERLLRAQGAMFFLMKENKLLQETIKNEFKLHKDILPFVIIDNV